MADTTAKILAKGTNATGITEALAEKLHDQLGRRVMFIGELVSDSRTENSDGDQKVNLKLSLVEPSLSPDMDDHLRDLQRALHYERKLNDADGQLTIDTREDLEPKVADVLAEGAKRRPHDFTPAPENKKACDTCGQGEDTPLHAAAALGDTGDQDDAA